MATSSNRVRVAVIPETVYGETPVAGNFDSLRFTSESFSGTPETVESQQIRIDRMSSGQVVTGLTVAGAFDFELAKESILESLLESLMYSTWQVAAAVTVDLEIDILAKELIRATGDWATDPTPVVVGDFLTLSGFASPFNNTQVLVTEIVSATVIKVEYPKTAIAAVGTGTSYLRNDKLSIANTKKSFSVEKQFTDLTTKGINYRGMIVDTMSLNVAYGELISGSFTLAGNDYLTAATAGELMTNGRTVNPPATTQTLNGSVDMPIIATDASGTFSQEGLLLQSIAMNINNNHTPQNAIGNVAPVDHTPGTTQVELSISAYLANESWDLMGKKLTQEPFSLAFMLKNAGGFYGFYVPQVQLTFEDPSSGGQNQDILFDATGMGKVGANGESCITFYRG